MRHLAVVNAMISVVKVAFSSGMCAGVGKIQPDFFAECAFLLIFVTIYIN